MIGDIILHHLEAAFRLSPIEGEAELVEMMRRQTEPLKQGAPDPTTAVVRPKAMIFDDEHPYILVLDPHLAGRNEDSKIGDRRLRPLLKPLRDRPFEFLVDGIITAVLRGTRSADEPVLDSTDGKPSQSLFHLGAPIVIELRARNFNGGDTNSG